MNINANMEYDFNLGDLNIRPGIAYQLAEYNDTEYLRYDGQGFLNSWQNFTSTAISLRADYMAFDKLRLIGAVRAEKYNTHDDYYLSYQAIASYQVNSKHLVRAVYSKANRGPFLVDTYANYPWSREGRPPMPSFILFQGEENLDLLTMNMLELGYRAKPLKNIQTDVELFYNQTDNYGALYPDSVNLLNKGMLAPWVRMSFKSLELTSHQYGVTGAVTWVATKDLYVKAYGTYQQTQLKNYIPYTQEETIQLMLEDAFFNNELDSTVTHSTSFTQNRESGKNEATPSFYGGIIVNYTYNNKITVNVNTYTYTQQSFDNKYGTVTIDPKYIVNAKISYALTPEAIVFGNVRNAFGSQQEFAFMDDIGTIVTGGITINFN
jgi:iron complex outermembrane receptor protein